MKDELINKWVAFLTKNGKIIESSDSFEKLYSKLDENREDIRIKYVSDPRYTISP